MLHLHLAWRAPSREPSARGLSGATTDLHWALGAHLLAFAAPVIAAGRVGDVCRRRVLFAGIAPFGIASSTAGRRS